MKLLSAFLEAVSTLPDVPKFLLLSALLLTFLAWYALRQLPAILHEAPPAIRALRELPGKPLPENFADSPKCQRN